MRDLQARYDAIVEAVRARTAAVLRGEPAPIGRVLAASVRELIEQLREPDDRNVRIALLQEVFDLAGLALAAGESGEEWHAVAVELAEGSRYAEVVALPWPPPWFLEARRISWRYVHHVEIGDAEHAYAARWADPIARRFGLR